ncbi:MAG TPA: ABC transporter substrate-binding protein [Candidatus Binatia bacterium]|jgi:ABC-type nitrate/sulfonate/bicarbonate transport system substrate-binding protein
MMKANSCALISAIFLVLLSQNTNAQTVTLRYGQIPSTVKTISALSFYIGQRKNFFAQEGINLEMMLIDGGAANMVIALNKGVVDITRTATPYLIQDVLKGSEGVAIAGETLTPIYSLIAKPEIKTFADLKGKVVGLSLAVDTISISTRKLMAKNGVKESDFKVKELVGTPARAACLRKGECDAVPLGQPEDFVLVKQGYQRLGVSTDAVPNFLFTVSAVRKSWGEKNKEALVRYVRGLASSYRFMRDPNQRDEVVRMAIEVTGSAEEIARQTLSLYFDPDRGVVPKQAELDVKGLNQVIQFMAEAGELKPPLPPPERFVDLQYLKAAGLQ